MKLDLFDFSLPESLIAVKPAVPRDSSRLMVVRRNTAEVEHKTFSDVAACLEPGDLLVLNTTKVKPVRLMATTPSGRSVEVLLVRQVRTGEWEIMVKPLKYVEEGSRIVFGGGVEGVFSRAADGDQKMTFPSAENVEELCRRHGLMPLPPYILKRRKAMADNGWNDEEWYQTTYAKEEGAIAAPTAGLHFTESVFRQLEDRGVDIGYVTLHVGPGTFLPVRTDEVEEHRMLPERVVVSPELVRQVEQTKERSGRVMAVGTTVTRSLETAARPGVLAPFDGQSDLFVTPGFSFRVIDGLLTNFHQPKSTPLMLVSAFAGRERTLAWYDEAMAREYRWLSYGDAMLVLP